ARRILAGTVRGSDERIFPGFWSFESGERPRWWREELSRDEWGPVIGVHEIGASTDGAIVVTERALAVYRDAVPVTWLSSAEIKGMDELSKEPLSDALVLRTQAGAKVSLPFPDGGAFAFVQYVAYVRLQLAIMSKG